LIEARLHGDQFVRLKIHAVESLMVNMPAFRQWAAGDVFPDHTMNILVSMWPGMKPWISLRWVATPVAERMSAGEFHAGVRSSLNASHASIKRDVTGKASAVPRTVSSVSMVRWISAKHASMHSCFIR